MVCYVCKGSWMEMLINGCIGIFLNMFDDLFSFKLSVFSDG